MNEEEKKKLTQALRQLVGSVVFLLLYFPVIAGLESLGIIDYNNAYVGYIAAMMIIPALVMGFRALVSLFDLLSGHFDLHLNVKSLFIGAGLCLIGTGTIRYVKEAGFALFGGVALVGGLWVLGKAVMTAFVLRRDGKTVYAQITEITHGTPDRYSGMTYTVTCRAGERTFKKKTDMPLDMSYIGKTVAVCVSSSYEDIYDIDLSRTFRRGPEDDGASGPGTEPEIAPEPADDPTAPAQPETPGVSQAPDHADFTPMDWKTARERGVKLPYSRIIFPAFLLIYDFLVFSSSLLRDEIPAVFLLITPVLSIWLLAVVLDLVKRYRIYRFGRQVRARIISAVFSNNGSNGDAFYKVTCRAADGEYSGKLQLRLMDPALTGKWVTVFVSRRFPKLYIIEGTTVGSEY